MLRQRRRPDLRPLPRGSGRGPGQGRRTGGGGGERQRGGALPRRRRVGGRFRAGLRDRAPHHGRRRAAAPGRGLRAGCGGRYGLVRRQRLLAGQPRGVLRGDGRRQVLESLEGARARSDQAHGQRPAGQERLDRVHEHVLRAGLGSACRRRRSSLRYTLGAGAEGSAIGDYRIETSLDGENYTLIKEGALSLDKDGRASLYFDNGKDPWICTYDARYLRITAVGQAGRQLSVAELDVFGPSGDDVLFRREPGQAVHSEGLARVHRLVQGQPGVQRGGALRRERQRGGRRERRRQHGCQPDHHGA